MKRPPGSGKKTLRYEIGKNPPKSRVWPGRLTVAQFVRLLNDLDVPPDAVIECEVDKPDGVGFIKETNVIRFD